MGICLLCLNIIENKAGSFGINSAQWEELDISKKIEKHFCSLIIVQPDSWICLSCWQEIDDFHKFYVRIEEAHMNFCKIKVEECKDDPITHTSNVKNNEESHNDNMEYCFLEPEILIDQTITCDITQPGIDSKPGDEINLDDVTQTNVHKCLKSEDYQITEDPLEKPKSSSSEKPKKKKQSKERDLEEGKHKDNDRGKALIIKEEPRDLNDNDSESLSDDDDHVADANYLPNKGHSKIKRKERKSCSNKLNREENDKFIAEHFKNMNCNICKEPLQNYPAMQKHFLDTHRQRGYVVCCNRKFFSRRDLVDHIHCHLNPDYFKCGKCDKVLSDRVRLEKHDACVHGSEEVAKKHSCDICGKSFLHVHYLSMHKLTHLPEEEKKFPCNECGKFYGSSRLLHRHMQAVHLRKFVKICYICGKSVSSSTDLKLHMDKHEGIPQPTINCDVCGLLLTTERGLKRHKDSQHPVDGKKEHHCPICPKISPTLKALRKHISTMHEKGYDHKCNICQKAFKRAEVLREHMASHTGTPLYTCSWCPKTFNSNGNMHAHRKKMHPKEWEAAKLQKYSEKFKANFFTYSS